MKGHSNEMSASVVTFLFLELMTNNSSMQLKAFLHRY